PFRREAAEEVLWRFLRLVGHGVNPGLWASTLIVGGEHWGVSYNACYHRTSAIQLFRDRTTPLRPETNPRWVRRATFASTAISTSRPATTPGWKRSRSRTPPTPTTTGTSGSPASATPPTPGRGSWTEAESST